MERMRILFIIVFTILNLYDGISGPPVPEGRRLRNIVADHYPEGNLLIGATTGEWGFDQPIGIIMDREFSYVTPENDFKHSVVRSDPNTWDWTKPDRWLEHIKENNQVLRIHGPIAPQCSKWARDDNRTPEELAAELDTFMTALCLRYNGVEGIKYLDVVNEIVLPDGKWHHPKPGTDEWENPWLIIGQDDDINQTPLYVKQAFEIANTYAPDLKLIINNHCHPGTKGMEKVKETALYLRDLGLRIDGIGWQAHVDVGWETPENLQHLKEVIQWCHDNNLEFHVTEFDAWIRNQLTQTFHGQARTYRAILEVMLNNMPDKGVMGWNTWHITDAAGWKTERKPSMFDDQYKPKPAYYAMQIALETKGIDTLRFNASFQVKDELTNEPLKNSQVIFGKDTLSSSEDGVATFNNIKPEYHRLVASKKHYDNYVKSIMPVYRDTFKTIYLRHKKYNIDFKIIEKGTDKNISSAKVIINADSVFSNYLGMANHTLQHGMYEYSVAIFGFKDISGKINVNSDTTITVALEKTHAEIKYSVHNYGQPVSNVEVSFLDQVKYTNSIGIVYFDSIPIEKEYEYQILKEGYFDKQGNLYLKSDTTIDILIREKEVDIDFRIFYNEKPLDKVLIILGNDSLLSDDEGFVSFEDVPVDQEYQFEVLKNSYRKIADSFWARKDTLIKVSLTSTGYKNHFPDIFYLYPNPAYSYICIESNKFILDICIININGKAIIRQDVHKVKTVIDVSNLVNGLYIVQTQFSDGSFRQKGIIIE